MSPAYAYLDPGTGSMVIQMTIAGVLSLTFAIKTYWYKIKSFLTGNKLEPLEDLGEHSDSASSNESTSNNQSMSHNAPDTKE